MSAAHFGLVPGLALQLATCVASYAASVRAARANPLDKAHLSAVGAYLGSIRELARGVPAVWAEWGRFAVAHAEFSLGRIGDPAAAGRGAKLMQLEECAEALMRKAVRWAVLVQEQFPVSMEVAQAFIEWEAARKVVFELRLAAASPATCAPETGEWLDLWESRSADLLLNATAVLKEPDPDT